MTSISRLLNCLEMGHIVIGQLHGICIYCYSEWCGTVMGTFWCIQSNQETPPLSSYRPISFSWAFWQSVAVFICSEVPPGSSWYCDVVWAVLEYSSVLLSCLGGVLILHRSVLWLLTWSRMGGPGILVMCTTLCIHSWCDLCLELSILYSSPGLQIVVSAYCLCCLMGICWAWTDGVTCCPLFRAGRTSYQYISYTVQFLFLQRVLHL